ncbi:MAG: hypothetical protein LAP38_17385 [Acidobacteriia bacterium]|nr:hypothetical protein [Terriglobia bacterium]
MVRWFVISLAACASCAGQWNATPFAPDSAPLPSADLREVLGLLCPGHEYIGQESGCHVCPAGTKAAGAKADASIETVIRGRFLKPDSDDLLVVLYGCGSALLTHSTSGWFVNRVTGVPDGLCRKVPGRMGRDGLVCFADSSSADRQSARLAFGFVPESQVDLAAAFDNTGGACDAPRRVVVQSAIREVRFIPGAAGKLTVRILANCRRGPLSARSSKACARGAGFEDISPAVPFRAFQIDYGFDGEKFSLAAASQAVKRAYDVCSAEVK